MMHFSYISFHELINCGHRQTERHTDRQTDIETDRGKIEVDHVTTLR